MAAAHYVNISYVSNSGNLAKNKLKTNRGTKCIFVVWSFGVVLIKDDEYVDIPLGGNFKPLRWKQRITRIFHMLATPAS